MLRSKVKGAQKIGGFAPVPYFSIIFPVTAFHELLIELKAIMLLGTGILIWFNGHMLEIIS
jgi:hypothetical protein